MADTGDQNIIGRDADGVLEAFGLKGTVQRRDGERRITSEVCRNIAIAVSFDDGYATHRRADAQMFCPGAPGLTSS